VSRSGSLPGDEGAGSGNPGDTGGTTAGTGTAERRGARDWRARKRDETHERIYTAAMRLFTEHGFEQVSVAQIAAAAGVSVPTFYAHFASKERVVLPVPTGEAIAAVLAGQPACASLADRVRGAILAWFADSGPEERAHSLARWRVVARSPALRVRAAEYERATAAMLVEALPPGPDRGTVRADDVVVTAYMAVLTAVLLAWAADDGRQALEDLADEAFDTLRRA
jgi:AcrR family transcriptional regulator